MFLDLDDTILGVRLRVVNRRTWFLERVLKLGLVQMAKEYQCVSVSYCDYGRDMPNIFSAVFNMS